MENGLIEPPDCQTVVADRFALVRDHYPVIIIGGGINGCGLFRDLSLQEIDCLLIEKTDFCSGASAAPSRLIHGGIKYLETGEFRLVSQSARERNLLLRNAPHYVKPLQTIIPMRNWLAGIGPSIARFAGRNAKMLDRGALITEIGLSLYDFFGRRFQTMPHHTLWMRGRLHREMPDLDKGILAAGLYYEARITQAERLGLELVLDGLAARPSCAALNHASVTCAGGALQVIDAETGRSRRVTADVVVNAGGAWIDSVNQRLGIQSSHMGGSKGSHLIVNNQRLHDALHGRMIYFGTPDGRVNLLYPFMGNVLIGSTDILVENPDEAVCSPEEFRYLIDVVAKVFPDIPIAEYEVIFTYCGVRPLPRADASDPSSVTRDHSIKEDSLPGIDVPVFSLIGGKWTTFRGFAEEAADLVLARLGRHRLTSTQDVPIGGGRDYPVGTDAGTRFIARLATDHGLTTSRASALFERYGSTAFAVASWCAATQDHQLETLPSFTANEIIRFCRAEFASSLADVLHRRTDIALSGRLTTAVATEVANCMAAACEWSSKRSAEEVSDIVQRARARIPL